MPKYQGKEITTQLQAPTKKELSKLIRSTQAYARRNRMEDIRILEQGKDRDGGYRAIVTAHNWNPIKWVAGKAGQAKEWVAGQVEGAREAYEEPSGTLPEQRDEEERVRRLRKGMRKFAGELAEEGLEPTPEKEVEFGIMGKPSKGGLELTGEETKAEAKAAGISVKEYKKRYGTYEESGRVLTGEVVTPEGRVVRTYETTTAAQMRERERLLALEKARRLEEEARKKPGREFRQKLLTGAVGEVGKGIATAAVPHREVRGPRMGLGTMRTGGLMSPSMLTGAGLGGLRQAMGIGGGLGVRGGMNIGSSARLFGLGGGQAVIERTALPPAPTGLTPTQQRVYDELVAGTPPETIPMKLGLKKVTVTNAIRQIGEKGALKQSQPVSTQTAPQTPQVQGRFNPLVIPRGGVNLASLLPGFRKGG